VHDPSSGRNDPEVPEGPLSKLEQLVAFPVPVELQSHVEPERLGASVVIHLDRMIDDQVAGNHRVDPIGITAHARHGIAHGGQIHHTGDPGEVLQHHAGRQEGKLHDITTGRTPGHHLAHMILGDEPLSAGAQCIFEEDTDGEGQSVKGAETLGGQSGQVVNRGLLGAEIEGDPAAERILVKVCHVMEFPAGGFMNAPTLLT